MRGECGSSLIECLLAASLSACVLLASLSMLQAANAAFVLQEQAVLLQENGRYAIHIIARALQQLSYVDYALSDAALNTELALQGQDNNGVNGSDVLTLHFAGSGADSDVINCAGFAIPVQTTSTQPDQGWSIFYVANNTDGEPELRCKYRGSAGWSSQAVVAGVESFQVLYGIDSDADGIVNQYLNADSVSALSVWSQVVAVRFALLLRAARDTGSPGHVQPAYFALFGENYDVATDTGTRIVRADLPAASKNWLRLVVQSTVYLPNTLQSQGVLP